MECESGAASCSRDTQPALCSGAVQQLAGREVTGATICRFSNYMRCTIDIINGYASIISLVVLCCGLQCAGGGLCSAAERRAQRHEREGGCGHVSSAAYLQSA